MTITKRKRSFRCGILLKIETGRYQNEPLQERCCALCKITSIEDDKRLFLIPNSTKTTEILSFIV